MRGYYNRSTGEFHVRTEVWAKSAVLIREMPNSSRTLAGGCII